jgi:multiple sugar transport system substrate-binding protein
MSAENPANRRTPYVSRREAFRLAAGAATGTLLTTRGGLAAQTPAARPEIVIPDTDATLPTENVTFRWIDSGEVARAYVEAYFPKYREAHPNITVDYQSLPNPDLDQVIPLSVQGGSAPDVFRMPPGTTGAQAVRNGWVTPLDDAIPNFDAWKAAFPPNSFHSGINVFAGKTYSFPLLANKFYATLMLYNVGYMQAAGYDPASKPLTWDEFRDAARKITEAGKGQYYGFIIGGNQIDRWVVHINGLAQMAGAPGSDQIDWRTGEYLYISDAYLAAVELLLALNADGSIFPGSLALNNPQARAMMPQGVAGMLLSEGGVLPSWIRESPQFNFGVAGQPVPNSGEPIPLSAPPRGSYWWVYAESQYKEIAGDMFAYLGSAEGMMAGQIAGGGVLPLAFPEANEASGLDPRVRQAFTLYDQQMRIGPDPRVRNPEAEQVYLELGEVQPGFGQVIQGIFTGQLGDPQAAMQDLQDRADAELERAIAAARDKGANVSRDDWVFPNWDPTRDYTEADYEALNS